MIKKAYILIERFFFIFFSKLNAYTYYQLNCITFLILHKKVESLDTIQLQTYPIPLGFCSFFPIIANFLRQFFDTSLFYSWHGLEYRKK